MAIWLSRPQDAHHQPDESVLHARLGAAADVLPREMFGALVSLEDAYAALAADRAALIEAAHDEAERIVDAGREQAGEILDAAQRERDDAARAGYRDGYDRALGDWMDRLADVAHAQNQLQVRMRERLADIVASAVEQIVRTENRAALFERALASVERIVDGATYLRVAVHPDDLDSAKDTFDRLATRWRELGRPIPMSVVGDKRLAPGSCICESDFGAVDASLDTQLRAMHGAVSRALKRTLVEIEAAAPEDDAAGGDPYGAQDGAYPAAGGDPYAAAPDAYPSEGGADPYADPHADPYAAQGYVPDERHRDPQPAAQGYMPDERHRDPQPAAQGYMPDERHRDPQPAAQGYVPDERHRDPQPAQAQDDPYSAPRAPAHGGGGR
ncbi:type III secretion system stator protein SctL [Burkholderia plantarii]|uniref:type III secretion system stator protein SctL n=1 Tax=Burkholderia plantarii TaxID=41899 RepID=UPI0009F32DBC|nr:type III secretion system stator protein SctL [Burkholderia plantarii]